MRCGRAWVREAGASFTVAVRAVSGVLACSGRLLIADRRDPGAEPRATTHGREELAAGVGVRLEAGHLYLLDVVVVPRSPRRPAVVRTVVAFDGEVAHDGTCERTAEDPLCDWKVTVP